MTRSLSLAAYMALARRSTAEDSFVPTAARPEGAVIWGHATSLEHANALIQMTHRLAAQRGGTPGVAGGGLHLLLTTGEDVRWAGHARAMTFHQPIGADSPSDACAFLAHWRPDVC